MKYGMLAKNGVSLALCKTCPEQARDACVTKATCVIARAFTWYVVASVVAFVQELIGYEEIFMPLLSRSVCDLGLLGTGIAVSNLQF